jgi:dTDP-4-amino-4,6-dideoxygalactose transaminase
MRPVAKPQSLPEFQQAREASLTDNVKVPFGDLQRQYHAHRAEYDEAVARVMSRGWFVLGEEGREFEKEFARYTGAKHCVACNSGTDAIGLALAAHGIGRGDIVMTVANTCVPTVVGITASGADIRLCDVDEQSALMDPSSLDRELTRYTCKAVVPVHLYGKPVDLSEISAIADRHGVIVVEDAAQAHGAKFRGKLIGSQGNTVAWSFYPSKNLGAFGDGGAVTTDDAQLAERLRMLRNYGQSRRYHHEIPGVNSRLDEMQAAVLRCRLPRLDAENARRAQIAQRYRTEIHNTQHTFLEAPAESVSCNHLFPILVQGRDAFIAKLASAGMQCLIHYPIPIHLQKAYEALRYKRGDFPIAESICDREVSLPMYPELTDAEVTAVIAAINGA